MKRLTLLFITLLSLMGITQMRADELTVCDGTVTNNYVPIYTYYADQYLKCEFIIPAAELSAMSGAEISKLKFYTSSSASWTSTGSFQVFLKEVSNTAVSEYVGTEGASID